MAISRLLLTPDAPRLASRSFLKPHDFLLPYIMEWEGDTDAQVVAAMAQQAATPKKKSTGKTRKGKADADSPSVPVDPTLGPPLAIDLEHCVVCGVAIKVKVAEEEDETSDDTTVKGKKGKEKREKKASAEKKNKKVSQAPWCYPCLMARTRLSARQQLLARSCPNTTQAPCALCGGTPETVLAVEDIFPNRKKAAVFGDPAGWVRRDTPWVCLPCASVYAVTGVKFGKLSAVAFAGAPDGSLHVQLQREIPWWGAPPSPCLMVYHRGQTGGIVQRLARTEVSVDPDTVVINIIDSTDRYPTRLTFSRASPDMQAEIHRTAAALAAMTPVPDEKDKKKTKKPPEFWVLLNELMEHLLPQTAHASPLREETRLQVLRLQGILRTSTKEGL